MCISKYTKKYHDQFYVVMRVLVGFMFFSHGAQKILGWFGGNKVALASGIGVAGLVELVGGLALLLGFWSRLAALGSAIIMIVAYVTVHAGNGLLPIVNKGELAVLYFVAFLIILAHGNGKCSLEKQIFNKEMF
jgi:putative oxidoreductase